VPLKAVLSTLDGVEDAVKGLYQEKDGSFVLDLEGLDDHPAVRGVITANRENRRKRDELRSELDTLKSKYDGLPEDFDASAYEALKAAKGDTKLTDEQIADIREKTRLRVEKDFQTKYAPIEQENMQLKSAVEMMAVGDGLSNAMDEAGIDPVHKSKLVPYLKTTAKIKVERTDEGAYRAAVETDLGPVSLNKFVQDWAASDDGKIYIAKSRGPNANGNGPRNTNGKVIRRSDFERMDPVAKLETAKSGVQIVD
jgi:outer membrane murein-binding lipoprotein Lpp